MMGVLRTSRRRIVRGAAASLLVWIVMPAAQAQQQQQPQQQQPPQKPALGAPLVRTPEEQTYARFREWAGRQPPDTPGGPDIVQRYRAKLAADGLAAAAIDREIAVIVEQGQRIEIERWNRILTSPNARFNHEPNAFLAGMIKGRTPGTALDVGMGQGRNALYLAKQGWTVTGFDPAAEAVALAEREAKAAGVSIKTATLRDDEFEFGMARWDLIVLSYVDVRGNAERVRRALKPGGIVVVEAFHRDATKQSSIGGAVVFDTNELLTMFSSLRVLRYEDTDAVADFGLEKTRVVRLCAEKP